jgi:nicotinamidase-related amidase
MSTPSFNHEFPIPAHHDPRKVDKYWKVPYQQRAEEARAWAEEHNITPAVNDEFKIALLLVDVQNTFSLPDFELFVAGRSGRGAVEDNRRLVEFIYRNLGKITHISFTMDTHQAMQIFHAVFLVDKEGNNPPPNTQVSAEDIRTGRWRFNTAIADSLGIQPDYGQRHLEHYVSELQKNEKYDLTIWPYHAMVGGLGHALVSAIEEAVFFHTIARYSQPDIEIKGNNPLTEHYSAVGPEVLTGPNGEQLAEKSDKLFQKVLENDILIIAGQAKSHCVAWTVEDLLAQCRATDKNLLEKIYLLEDCSSPVVVPEIVDFTDQAETAFRRFAEAGMHIVRSPDPIRSWPGIDNRAFHASELRSS